MREILVDWTGPGSSPKVSVLYFDETGAIADQVGAINTLITAYRVFMNSSYSARVRETMRLIDEFTGDLQGIDTFTTPPAITGSAAGSPVADASQVLCRWRTGTVRRGRFLQGRTYLPGCSSGQIVGGNVSPTMVTTMSGAAQTFATSAGIPLVWSRPSDAGSGLAVPMTAGSIWSEFAVQRGRRG